MTTSRKRRSRKSGLGTGTTSLLMIFTLLCLSTLAMLSLSTASSEARIKERSLQYAQALAEAEGRADTYIAEIDAILADTGEIEAVRNAMYIYSFASYWEGDSFTFVLPIDEESELHTTLLLVPGGSPRYAITGQTMVSTAEWQPEGPTVWPG